jgi:hypothetical protein
VVCRATTEQLRSAVVALAAKRVDRLYDGRDWCPAPSPAWPVACRNQAFGVLQRGQGLSRRMQTALPGLARKERS